VYTCDEKIELMKNKAAQIKEAAGKMA